MIPELGFGMDMDMPKDYERLKAYVRERKGIGKTSGIKDIIRSANIWESGIRRTTPVWMYPQGKSADYNVYDLGGNVWEWQVNRYSHDSGSRVLRGGSFDGYQDFARCADRYWYYPVDWGNFIGFHLCLRP